MPTRKIKNTVILAAVAATPGADAAPIGASNAILVTEMSITPFEAQNITRDLMSGGFGGKAELVGTATVKVSIKVELAGSGAAATPPAWGKLMLGCAMAEGILTAPARVEYTPVSTDLKDLTIYYYDDGVLHKLFNAMGAWSVSAKVNERPTLKFEFTGVDGAMSAVPNAVPNYSTWKIPVAMVKSNVVDVTLGGTYAAGALAGGTVYPSNGLEIASGNQVEFLNNLSTEKVDITDRDVTGSVEYELTAVQEVTRKAKVQANELETLGFTIGKVAGNTVMLFAPSVQHKGYKKVDVKGTRYAGFDLSFLPITNNDEFRIVCM
jgi:hypothetical protein